MPRMPKTKTPANLPRTRADFVPLDVPILEHGSPTLRRLDCILTPRQSKALRLVFDGLVANGATLTLVGERRELVASQADAVRWLLEQVAKLSASAAE